MASELSWFPCEPTPLLGALGGMKMAKKLVYLIMILRIYECGGGCPDTIEAIAVRCGMNKRITSDALDDLFRDGRLLRGEGGIRNPKADAVIAHSKALHERRKAAGANGGFRKAEKIKQNQQNQPSPATPELQPNPPHRQLQEQDSLFSNENRVPAPKPEPARPKVAKPKPEPVDDGWPADYLEQFWVAFPPFRRTGKKQVGEKLARIRAAGAVTWSALMAGLTRYAMSDPGEFAKAPIAWLNSSGWEGVYKIQNGGIRNETNRRSATRDGLSILTARLRQGMGERADAAAAARGEAAGYEPGDGSGAASPPLVGMA